MKMKYGRLMAVVAALMFLPMLVGAETGADLWLRYSKLPESMATGYRKEAKSLVVTGNDATQQAAAGEIRMALRSLLGTTPTLSKGVADGSIVLATSSDKIVKDLIPGGLELSDDEAYVIRTVSVKKGKAILIAGRTTAGILYGTFDLLRRMQNGEDISNLDINEQPAYKLRLLNHWDNLNGTVERGYAGHSIFWNREESFEQLKDQYLTYARANASVGINGTVLNNVNASPEVLNTENLERVKQLADLFRPYNIKVYLAVNFASPAVLGGLDTADPLDENVQQWWRDKAAEIYKMIPDFGGFLVKANSEGQPGPMDFGRTHQDGANMLAGVLKPHNGVVMWRAFVYEPTNSDRAMQAYNEFMPFDGKFADNVIVQVKNGPVDFQPREPFSPLFGAMQKTPLMVEFQITLEYLGHSNQLAYLATMWKEVLDADTWALGAGSSVARATDGSLFGNELTAIAGVANIGRDINWCGHDLLQSNWYAFGRLAWNHQLSSEQIAEEWIRMTFTNDDSFVSTLEEVMMRSREAVVSYMTPMGLHHLMGWDHHYGPEPWTDLSWARADWLPRYYHRAGEDGIGFDRSSKGSNAVSQYFSPLREMYDNPATCPENLLLWFHHLPWDYRLASGKTLWDALVYKYYEGVEQARFFQKEWDKLEGKIDQERFEAIRYKFKQQTKEAIWWRDACVLYFQTFSKRPIPAELERPVHDLDELKSLKFDLKHHN
jgi:alpha-glucuronidase